MTELTSELLRTLAIAQLEHVHNMTDRSGKFDGMDGIDAALHSDDCYDYLRGALNLGSNLLSMQFDDDLAGFRKLMDPADDEFAVKNYATDGICPAIWDALPADWEDICWER